MPYRPHVNSSLCFVLMPYQPNFEDYYENIIKRAVTEAGLTPLRAKDVYGTQPIAKDIWDQIWQARLVIADVTSRNANVNYELGLCHALSIPTIIITQSMDDVPFDYKHNRCVEYETRKTGWEQRLAETITRTIAATLERGFQPDLPWPYSALGIEAGLDIRNTRYRFAEVLDQACRYVLMTGTNFGDQFGSRESTQSSLLHNAITHLLSTNPHVNVQLTFSPPRLLKSISLLGYKDLVEMSLPKMWDLLHDPQIAPHRHRLKISSHPGAQFLAAFVRDPDDHERGLIITTPRWISDERGRARMFVAIWQKERPELFRTLWSEMEPSLRLHEDASLEEVVDELSGSRELGSEYGEFVRSGCPGWKLRSGKSRR